MVLPMSTFALAIGPWEMFLMIDGSKCKSSFDEIGESSKPIDTIETNIKTDEKRCVNIHEPYPCHIERGDSGPLLPCRIFGPSNLISQITSSLSWQQYIPACLQASYELLGSHPFSKLDLLFLPRCFSGLGLASPNLIFLSPSLLVNRGKVGRIADRYLSNLCSTRITVVNIFKYCEFIFHREMRQLQC